MPAFTLEMAEQVRSNLRSENQQDRFQGVVDLFNLNEEDYDYTPAVKQFLQTLDAKSLIDVRGALNYFEQHSYQETKAYCRLGAREVMKLLTHRLQKNENPNETVEIFNYIVAVNNKKIMMTGIDETEDLLNKLPLNTLIHLSLNEAVKRKKEIQRVIFDRFESKLFTPGFMERHKAVSMLFNEITIETAQKYLATLNIDQRIAIYKTFDEMQNPSSKLRSNVISVQDSDAKEMVKNSLLSGVKSIANFEQIKFLYERLVNQDGMAETENSKIKADIMTFAENINYKQLQHLSETLNKSTLYSSVINDIYQKRKLTESPKETITLPNSSQSFTETKIIWQPKKVTDADFKKNGNGMLMSDAEIKTAKALLKSKNRIAKTEDPNHPLPYTVMKMEDPRNPGNMRYFAVYKGEKHKDEFDKGRHLGKGQFGTVKLMQDLDSGEWFVAKVMEVGKESHRVLFAEEASALESVNKNTPDSLLYQPQALGSITRRETNKEGELKDQVVIGMEYLPGGDLYDLIDDNIQLPSARWVTLGKNMIQAVAELHGHGYWHRDIKPGNYTYNALTDKVTLVDYGMLLSQSEELSQIAGTPFFMAPEFLLSGPEEGIATAKTESYAIGVSLAEIYGLDNTVYPYGPKLPVFELRDISSSQFAAKIPNPDTRKDIYELIKNMTDPNPDLRIDVQTAMSRMNAIANKEISVTKHFRTVGILDIDAYREALPDERLKIRRQLQSMDDVRLISRDPVWLLLNDKDNVRKMSMLVNELKKEGINNVVPTIVHPETVQQSTDVSQLVDAVMQSENAKHRDFALHYTAFTKDKTGSITPKFTLDSNMLKLIESELASLVTKLESKSDMASKKRIELLTQFKNNLSTIPAGEMPARLKKLEQSLNTVNLLTKKNIVGGSLLKWMSKGDAASQGVRDLRKSLEAPIIKDGPKRKI